MGRKPNHRLSRRLFPDLPMDEVERRKAADSVLANYKEKLARAQARYDGHWQRFEARVDKMREQFMTSRLVLWATEVRDVWAAKVKLREAEITSKVSRECYLKKNQAHVDHGDRGKHWEKKRQEGFALQARMQKMRDAKKPQNTNTTPPNEIAERQSNGSLESPNMDGAWNPDADNKVPGQG